jgi:DNA-binding NarL/FixJ family response regulator
MLTTRELDVLRLMSQGYSTKEIAERLFVSFNTVESHRKHMLEKFGARNSADLMKKATKIYWLP